MAALTEGLGALPLRLRTGATCVVVLYRSVSLDAKGSRSLGNRAVQTNVKLLPLQFSMDELPTQEMVFRVGHKLDSPGDYKVDPPKRFPNGQLGNSDQSEQKNWYTSRFVRVILAQGPC
mmetsp:Transcript_3695/g.7631  ORF Transcript_3695/g.7631 Transcript_3695/m.7631 type:complete len:119 (-) Transcript_3695:55-411(-)